MFGFTSTARLRQEVAVRDARIAKLMQERDDARSERDAFKAAAEITARRYVEDAPAAAALHARLDRALRGAARYLGAYWVQRELTRQQVQQTRQMDALVKGLHERLTRTEKRAIEAETELRASAAYRGERLIEGGRFRRMTASDEVQQLRAQARELDKRLRELTEINQRCRCGGGAS